MPQTYINSLMYHELANVYKASYDQDHDHSARPIHHSPSLPTPHLQLLSMLPCESSWNSAHLQPQTVMSFLTRGQLLPTYGRSWAADERDGVQPVRVLKT